MLLCVRHIQDPSDRAANKIALNKQSRYGSCPQAACILMENTGN